MAATWRADALGVRKSLARNAPEFNLPSELYRLSGIDWSQINGIDVLTQTVIAEVGVDLSAFGSEKQFASWLAGVYWGDGNKAVRRCLERRLRAACGITHVG